MKTLIERLRAGEILFGGTIVEPPHSSIAKMYRNAGFDFIFLENEHIAFDHAQLTDFIIGARDNGLSSVAKIPELARTETARLLEMGVVGIQLPRTESRKELEQLRSYIKFPPHGTRASATGLGNTAYAKPTDKLTWYRQADDETFLIAHIETRNGASNIEEILSLPKLDLCFVGTSDLSLDLGMPGDYLDPNFLAAVQRVFDACKKRGIICGIPATDYETAKYWIDYGVQFFECHSELDLIRAGAARAVEELHRARGH